MTIEGAIVQLQELIDNDGIPFWAKPSLQKIMETVEAEREEHLWIPVTERLPNSNGCYLVWRPHFFGGEVGMPSICYFDGQDTWHDSYGVDFMRVLSSDDVVAWMPLPRPYEEGADE